jgi:hypothetical protein
MVIIRFQRVEMRRQALGRLLGRFSGKSWVIGELMVPEAALAFLAAEGVQFTVEGPATYDRVLALNQSVEISNAEREPASLV